MNTFTFHARARVQVWKDRYRVWRRDRGWKLEAVVVAFMATYLFIQVVIAIVTRPF